MRIHVSPVAEPGAGTTSWWDERTLHVLLDTDDDLDRQVAGLLLSRLGHETAVTAEAARRYDVVLTGMSPARLDAVRRLRAEPGEQPYVVAMATNPADRASAYAAGVDAFLFKAIRLPDLEAVLVPVSGATHRARDHAVRSRLADLLGPGPSTAEKALVADLIDTFLARSSAAAQELTAAVAAGDAHAARTVAHRVKGSAGNVGASVLCALAAALEDLAGTGTIATRSTLVPRIVAEVAAMSPTFVAVRDHLTRHG